MNLFFTINKENFPFENKYTVTDESSNRNCTLYNTSMTIQL